MTLWAPWLGDFDNLNLFYRKIKIEKMPKFETLLATRGLKEKKWEFSLLDEGPSFKGKTSKKVVALKWEMYPNIQRQSEKISKKKFLCIKTLFRAYI